jgi:hypothetical protein
MTTISKSINGAEIQFDVKYQPRYKADAQDVYWLKIINVRDGVGFGAAPNWIEALKMARDFASLRVSND